MATNPTRTVSLRSAADLGFALAEIRSDRDRTQAQVAQSVGMDRSQLAHLEAGRTGRFLDNVLVLLAELGAEVTIRWSISDPEVEETTTVTAALPAPPTAARLAPVRRNRVVPPSIGESTTRPVEPRNRLGEQFRRQQEAMERALAPIRRQAEAMERALAPARDSIASAGDPAGDQFRDQLVAKARAARPAQRRDDEDGDKSVDRTNSPS